MTRDGERPVEQRLRQALGARAEGIDIRRLRPAEPPGPHLRRLPAVRLRRFTLPLAGLAAAAAAGVGYLLLAPGQDSGPLPPATPPKITAPGPSVEPPQSPSPQPSSPSAPTPGPATSPAPVRSLTPSAPATRMPGTSPSISAPPTATSSSARPAPSPSTAASASPTPPGAVRSAG